HLTLAAIAATETALADVVVTGVLRAAGADPDRFLSTNAAQERHVLFLPSGSRRRLSHKRAAALGFTVHHLQFLLALGGEIHEITLQTVAIGAVLGHETGQLLGVGGVLIFADAFLERVQHGLDSLD